MTRQNYPLNAEDFQHLVAGGILRCGETQIALSDIGINVMAEAVTSSAGNTRFNEIRDVEEPQERPDTPWSDLTIVVQGGVVQEVWGLPEGVQYVINDLDIKGAGG